MTAFNRSSKAKDGKAYYCKACQSAYSMNWMRQNGGIREHNLRRTYGITTAEYDDMLAQQGGACAICRTTSTGRHAYFSVDHDHTTGQVRGLLCQLCNTGLGAFKDKRESLEAALSYLMSFQHCCSQ